MVVPLLGTLIGVTEITIENQFTITRGSQAGMKVDQGDMGLVQTILIDQRSEQRI